MIKIGHAQLWVHDQDEALAFYTQKVGLEVKSDVTVPELGNFRWLAVGPAGQPEVSVVLMAIPGPPVFEPETTEQVRDLMAKGAASSLTAYPSLADAYRKGASSCASSASSSMNNSSTSSWTRIGSEPSRSILLITTMG